MSASFSCTHLSVSKNIQLKQLNFLTLQILLANNELLVLALQLRLADFQLHHSLLRLVQRSLQLILVTLQCSQLLALLPVLSLCGCHLDEGKAAESADLPDYKSSSVNSVAQPHACSAAISLSLHTPPSPLLSVAVTWTAMLLHNGLTGPTELVTSQYKF